jgi:hypothetical protein
MPTFVKQMKLLNSRGASRCIPNFHGLLLRNQWKFLMGWSITLTRVLLGNVGALYIIGVYRFSKFCALMIRCNGPKYLVLRLKAMQMMLMQCAAGQQLPKPLSGQRFKRSSSGLPSLLPVEHRRKIMKGDPRIMAFWMSLFGFYRVLIYPGKVSLGTIVLPGRDFSVLHDEIKESFYSSLRSLHRKSRLPEGLCPESWKGNINLNPGEQLSSKVSTLSREGLLHTIFPIFKSSPSPWTREVGLEGKGGDKKKGDKPEVSHGWYAMVDQAKALTRNPVWDSFRSYAIKLVTSLLSTLSECLTVILTRHVNSHRR